jgi:GNAT superfamily N-acetyltransferase
VVEYINSIKDKNIKFLMANIDGVKVGFCYAQIDVNFLKMLYLKKDILRQGVGTALYFSLEPYFDKNKPITVTVFSYNEGAIKFYENLGFIKTNKVPDREFIMPISGVKVPRFVMEKPVNKL